MQIGELRVEQLEGGIALVALTGEHDLNTAPELGRALDEGVKGAQGVVVDLSRATFVDSTILGVILEGRRRALAAGRGFAVANDGTAPAVTRVLEITGLRTELPVHAASPEAVAAARPAGGEGAEGTAT